jgi:hypothetical protein
MSGALRTFEVFGIVGGRLAPMTSAITNNGGRWSVVPGASVMITEAPNEGYGLAGTPGRWSSLYAGRSPAEFGLDADKAVLASDGSRGLGAAGHSARADLRRQLAAGCLLLDPIP